MKKTATLLALTGLALSSNVEGNFQDDELFAQIAARAGVWALTHPQQITKGVEVGLRSAPAVIGGVKKGYDWIRHRDDADDEFFAQDQDDELFAEEDNELFAQIAARAGVWALTHPQQITKGVEVGLRSAPAVIGGVKKGYDWIRHHDDDELFAEGDDEFFVEGDQDNELFAQIAARAGVWALTHPQQITKGVEVGLRSAPAVIGGVKKGYDWIRHRDDADDEFFAQDQDDEFYAEEDNELFAQIAARAGVWALTHPQQITKGVEVGLRSAPAVIGGVKKGYDWIRHHDDNDDELFVEKKSEVKPKKNGQKLRRNHHVEAEKSDLAQLGDLIKESHKL
jgi:rRNA processing protein Gar1